ncbi:MAG: hypothetical protein WBP33_07915 [Saprospiraceae bacterium]|nr:hypothetical protein [Candidatus Vicinibacter proximus]HRG31826.1 hypothetical protein [Saprospiraceae bacterium]
MKLKLVLKKKDLELIKNKLKKSVVKIIGFFQNQINTKQQLSKLKSKLENSERKITIKLSKKASEKKKGV